MIDEPGEPRRARAAERGFALVTVVLVLALLFVMATALMLESGTERLASTNEQDYVRAFAYAEGGMAWAKRRVTDAGTNVTDLLNGPNNGSASDDYLIGLRSLGLTATSQFTTANEGTASAIVSRDFGDGAKNYEALRLPADATDRRAHVFVRLDDNYDDTPLNPATNVPLTDTDGIVNVTVVAEYPVFVGASGAEVAGTQDERGRARRILRAQFGSVGSPPFAFATNGDIDMEGGFDLCGACADVHSNQALYNNSGNAICGDGTCTGSFSGTTSGISGASGGGRPALTLPIISIYDPDLVPAYDDFGLLGCGAPTATDPGNSKYFALAADGSKGRVYKAYWDFTRNRWTWRLIDNLNDGTDVKLDNCGRAPGDPSYGTGVSDKPGDVNGLVDEFYGFKVSGATSTIGCGSCGTASGDQSLCTLANNNYVYNGYYDAGTGSPRGQNVTTTVALTPPLPGNATPDGSADWVATSWLKDGNWTYSSNNIFSPLYGAVLFFYANVEISGNPGNSSSINYCQASGCSTSLPDNHWKVTLLSYGDIVISGNMTVAPANTAAGYAFQMVAGRDLRISGNPNEYGDACGGGCGTSAPANIAAIGGVYAAHEQIQLNGNPHIFGFMVAEDALDCSTSVNGEGRGVSTINGDPRIFYDCVHPPNPWATAPSTNRLLWMESP